MLVLSFERVALYREERNLASSSNVLEYMASSILRYVHSSGVVQIGDTV